MSIQGGAMRMSSWMGIVATVTIGVAAGGAVAQSGYALEFDGDDDRVVVADPVNVTGPLTLEAWIRCDAFDGGRILSNRNAANGYEMDIDASGWLRFTIDGSVKCHHDITAHLGEWIHVAVTWAGPGDGSIVMYLDGETLTTDSFAGTMSDATGILAIGMAAWDQYTFSGAIDEPRIFDTVVDGDTIRTWMNRRIDPGHPDYAHLRGAWCFEDGAGQVAACEVAGLDGQLGTDAGEDAADPAWVASGMVEMTRSTWGEVKETYGR
jgi:hypothetical protein